MELSTDRVDGRIFNVSEIFSLRSFWARFRDYYDRTTDGPQAAIDDATDLPVDERVARHTRSSFKHQDKIMHSL